MIVVGCRGTSGSAWIDTKRMKRELKNSTVYQVKKSNWMAKSSNILDPRKLTNRLMLGYSSSGNANPFVNTRPFIQCGLPSATPIPTGVLMSCSTSVICSRFSIPMNASSRRVLPDSENPGPRRSDQTRIIKSNTSELVSQAFDDVAVLKQPERHAVQEKEHWTVAFVDVVDLISFDLYKVAGERELLLVKP